MTICHKHIGCSIYLILYTLYSILSVINPGTTISRLLLLLFMVSSMFYMVRCLSLLRKGPSYIKCLFGLLMLFSVYGFLYVLSPYSYTITEGVEYVDVPKIEYLKNIYLSLLPIFAFYYFASKGAISEVWVRVASIILLALAVFLYTYTYQFFVINDVYGRTEMTNNYGYSFVALFPLLCFWHKRPIIQLAYTMTLLVFIIMSMKRGAMLIGTICAIYFIHSIFRRATKWGRFGIVVALGVLLYVGIPMLSEFIAGSEKFQQRILQTMSGDASNRDMLYSTAISHIFNETTFFEFLFGSGADSSIAILTNYAHNDWLEIGINQGIMGVIIYILYFFAFFRWWKGCSQIGLLHVVGGLCFIICFLSTFFSMSYNSMDISLSLCLGYALAMSRMPNIRQMLSCHKEMKY